MFTLALADSCTYTCDGVKYEITSDLSLCAVKQSECLAKGGTKTGTPKSAKVGDAAPSPVSMDQQAPDMHKAIGAHAKVLFDVSQIKDFDIQYNDLAGGSKNLVFECWNSRDNADYGCLEKFSTKIQSGAKMMGPILASVSMVAGTSMACSKWGDALKVLQGAMAAYNAECGFMKGRCDTRCVDANERMQNFSASVENICNEDMMKKLFNPQSGMANYSPATSKAQFVTACSEVRGYVKAQLVNTRKGSVANNMQTCKSYSEQYMAGVMGLMGTIQSNRLAQSCDKDSGDQANNCAANPTAPGCNQEKTCDDPSKSNSPECICERNPRAPGCGAAVSSAGNSDYGTPNTEGGSRSRASVASLPPGAGGGGDAGIPPAGKDAGTAAAGAGGGSYGGGGASGGGSGAGKSAADKNAASVAGSRTGDGGFSEGGGGGRSMRFTPGNRDTASKSPLNRYMPKAGDGMIGAYQPGSNPSVEITGPHGKNLFDKISDRYREIGPQMNP